MKTTAVVQRRREKGGVSTYTALREVADGLRKSAGNEAAEGDERSLHVDGWLRVGEKVIYYDICAEA